MTARMRLVWCVMLGSVLPGCASMTVEQYPDFYTPEIKTIAVFEFEGLSRRGRFGWEFTDRLVCALSDNGTYRVHGPYKVRAELASAGIVLPRWADRDTIADALRQAGGVQAFIIGQVEAVEPSSSLELRRWLMPCRNCQKWTRDRKRKKKRSHVSNRDRCQDCENRLEARVAVRAEIIRVSDGKTLHRTRGAVENRIQRRDCFEPPEELLEKATEEVVKTLVEKFAVVRKTISLSKKKAFRIVRRVDGEGLKSADAFGQDEKELIIIVSLPRGADKNRFRVVVTRIGSNEELASESFIWSWQDSERIITFSPAGFAEVTGPGDYEAKFYSGRSVVIKKKFRIESASSEESK